MKSCQKILIIRIKYSIISILIENGYIQKSGVPNHQEGVKKDSESDLIAPLYLLKED